MNDGSRQSPAYRLTLNLFLLLVSSHTPRQRFYVFPMPAQKNCYFSDAYGFFKRLLLLTRCESGL